MRSTSAKLKLGTSLVIKCRLDFAITGANNADNPIGIRRPKIESTKIFIAVASPFVGGFQSLAVMHKTDFDVPGI
jgi:hypothetical protein